MAEKLKMNYLEIKNNIQKISNERDFFRGKCEVLAVSKFQSIEKIEELSRQGQIYFGENYVQEALDKISFSKLKNLDLQWHLIGHLQKNKVKFLEQNFALIHSVDSFELAEKISARLAGDQKQKVLLQINVSQESSKEGFTESELFNQWDEIAKLPQLEIHGLMTMPPLENTAERNRPYFIRLREILKELQIKNSSSQHILSELSMGTSADYSVAAEEGSTWLRLGTMLFGERPQK